MKQLVVVLCTLLFITSQIAVSSVQQPMEREAKIQMAILLDTSGSMSGLVDQTRNQLWQAVNRFSQFTRHDVIPNLEVAVFEYGNSNLTKNEGYVRQVIGLTPELDKVSEALFSLTTSGGDEYCGFAIKTAVQDLRWSSEGADIKTIFIAGNEPFSQGPISYKQAINLAKEKNIVVNTIHAGTRQDGIAQGWEDGALVASGDYMHIDHNHQVAHFSAPQDKRIIELNEKLNATYLPYGTYGNESKLRQMEQDKQNKEVSASLMAKRAKSKASSFYTNSNWDLVDAMELQSIELGNLPKESLPEPMRDLNLDEKKAYINYQSKMRKRLKTEIKALGKSRDVYIRDKKAGIADPNTSTIDKALYSALAKQAKDKGFQIHQD